MELFDSVTAGERETFVASDGVRLEFRTSGPPHGPPVLFFYGLVCSPFHFHHQWNHLKATHRVIALGYRGHFDTSQTPTRGLSLKRLAEDHAELVEHLRLRASVSVIAHSMGVNLALEWVAKHQKRTQSLVLIGGAPRYPVLSRRAMKRLERLRWAALSLEALAPELVTSAWRLIGGLSAVQFLASGVGFNSRLSSREDIHGVFDVMERFPPSVFFHLLGEYLRQNQQSLLKDISLPTLVVAGEQDQMVPFHFQYDMHRSIPMSELLLVRDGSHCPQLDRPQLVNDRIQAFLERA